MRSPRTSRSTRAPTALAAAIGTILAIAAPSRAGASPREACARDAESGQRLRDDARLLEARARFVACGAEACPAVVRRMCIPWLAEVEARLPSLVFFGRDREGRDLLDARVLVDGAVAAEALDGRERLVDPGAHEIVLETHAGDRASRRIVVVERERGRKVSFDLSETVRSEPASSENDLIASRNDVGQPGNVLGEPLPADPGAPVLPIVLALSGAAGVGASIYLGVTARSDATRLREGCAPRCDPGAVDAVERRVVIADVALLSGAVVMAAAAILYLWPGDEPPDLSALPLPAGDGVLITTRFE